MKKELYNLKWNFIRPQALPRFNRLVLNESVSIDELLATQEQQRQKIVKSAMRNTAFYARHYSAVGIEVGDIGKDGWFEQLPVVTKKELRDHFNEFVNPTTRQFLRTSTTGGSTGNPVKTGYDGRIPEEAYSWRLQNWFGVHPWDNHAYIWRDTRSGAFARLKNAAMWWPTKHVKLDATFITEEAIVTFLNKCQAIKPKLIMGYVGALSQVAQYVVENNMHATGKSWQPKVAWATSAPLSPVQREIISQAFGTPVCDQYGSCEIRWIAQQCALCRGLHVNIEHVYLEYVDAENKPLPKGEYGRSLLTNLEDEAFPLIRYENGDRGRWLTEKCECGCSLPCIDSVKGRESESFVLPSGKTVNGEYLTTIFDGAPDLVRGFRVIQHKDLSITIEFIPTTPSASAIAEISDVLSKFAKHFDGEVPIEYKQVNNISHDRGKLRFVIRET